MNADGGNVRRVTQSAAIDTEAYFMPDGKSLLFTSDRGGSPQIYRHVAWAPARSSASPSRAATT